MVMMTGRQTKQGSTIVRDQLARVFFISNFNPYPPMGTSSSFCVTLDPYPLI